MKKIIALILAISLVITVLPSAFALDATDYGSAKSISVGSYIQANNVPFTDTWYKFTADEDQYYKVSILNQSVELRTNIYFDSWLDSSLLAGLFNGKLQVAIRDSHGLELAEGFVRCGYEGSVYLLLNKGQTYYIGFNSNYSGNFRFKVDKLNDIGGNAQDSATEITATSQIITMVDATNDEDWFTFTTDSDHSFYHFSVENLNCSQSLDFELYEYVDGAGLRRTYDTYVNRSNTRQFNVELEDNTKYYYKVTSSSVGGYVINVEQVYDEVGAEKDDAYKIERDVKITSSYDGDSDTDFYRFTTGSEDAYYHINYTPLTSSYYYITLIDKAGTKLIDTSRNGSYTYSGNIKLEKNTEYYVSFRGDKRGNYEFSVDTVADPVADVKADAAALERDKKIAATYAGDKDTDFYKFTTANEDAYYHINYTPLTEVYYYITLIDKAGTKLIDTSRHGSYTYSGNIKLEKNTEYYVSFRGDKRGNYEFSVDTVADPGSDTKSQAVPIQRDKKITATYAGNGDVDFYKFKTATEDAYYQIDYAPLTESYYYITLTDNTGNRLIDTSRYGGYTYSGNIKLEKNTEYYISFMGDVKGSYEFSVTTIPDPEGDSKADTQAISLNTEIKADLASDSDVDWYKFTVSDFENLRIRLFNESGATKRVYLYSERDASLINFSVSSGSYSKTKELEEGTYYLKVSDNSGYYTLVAATCGNEHQWALKRVIKPASCKEKGKEAYYCTCCFETENRDVPKLTTHSFVWETVSEPTATADGKKRQVCSVCSAYGESQIIPRDKPGDVDFDGKITAADARFTLRASVGLEKCEKGSKEFMAADADRNNTISAADARLILRASVGLEKLN